MTAKKSESTELGFGQAMAELEEILRRIEGEEIDIDLLASELKRAAELLDLCRSKIRRAEVEVSQIVQSLESAAAEDAAGRETRAPRGEEAEGEGGGEEGEGEEDGEEDQDDLPF